MQARHPSSAHSQQVALHARQMRSLDRLRAAFVVHAFRASAGVQFRRQVPLPPLHRGFPGARRKLVVEVDVGTTHAGAALIRAGMNGSSCRIPGPSSGGGAGRARVGVAVARVREALGQLSRVAVGRCSCQLPLQLVHSADRLARMVVPHAHRNAEERTAPTCGRIAAASGLRTSDGAGTGCDAGLMAHSVLRRAFGRAGDQRRDGYEFHTIGSSQ